MKKALKRLACAFFAVCIIVGFLPTAFALDEKTSFEYRRTQAYDTLKKFYPDFEKLANDGESVIPVPGTQRTVFPSGECCDSMTVQGIECCEDYLFITAYDKKKEHNSVLYVIKEESGSASLLSVIVLPDKSHCGAVACDGEYLWIADGTQKQLCAVRLEKVLSLAESSAAAYVTYDMKEDCPCTASFITYDGSFLWVGEFDRFKRANFCALRRGTDGFETVYTLKIPKKSQGAAFIENGGKKYLAVNTSYGRNRDSVTYIYSVSDDMKLALKKRYIMPAMLEDMAVRSGKILTISESCCGEYYADSKKSRFLTLDRVAALDTDKLVNGRAANVFSSCGSKICRTAYCLFMAAKSRMVCNL